MFVLLTQILAILSIISYQEQGSESSCIMKESGKIDCKQESLYKLKLFSWDPVEIGHERDLELVIGKTHKLVTKSINPPVFTVDNYMEDYECDYIIEKAKLAGLFSSELHLDPETIKAKNYSNQQLLHSAPNFDWVDKNKNGVIDVPIEIQYLAYNLKLLYLNDSEVHNMLIKFQANISHDDERQYITKENYIKINLIGMQEYMKDLREFHPQHRDRYSEQVWLSIYEKDKIIDKLTERLAKLTNLQEEIVYGTEPIQIVHYLPQGHYHAHFDSQNASAFPNWPCCHTEVSGTAANCRLCRFLTALVFLNDVQKGGETAFPVADDPTYTHEEYMQRRKGDMYNLSKFCHNSTLVVKPKKGTMVLWYNHKINDEGLLGILDPYSLHGGCDVLEGEKWIANNWIPAPDHITPGYRNIYKPESKIKDSIKETTEKKECDVQKTEL